MEIKSTTSFVYYYVKDFLPIDSFYFSYQHIYVYFLAGCFHIHLFPLTQTGGVPKLRLARWNGWLNCSSKSTFGFVPGTSASQALESIS